jgi:hypothetical protein
VFRQETEIKEHRKEEIEREENEIKEERKK